MAEAEQKAQEAKENEALEAANREAKLAQEVAERKAEEYEWNRITEVRRLSRQGGKGLQL